ncbi:uncharacterized protein LOC129769918 isoform X2 [Toxorhynchites rutilus septentrionalis]|nr:uncharacterized protein LOC129769918 isoform X2 [Toxorhynchites rutilus septentrionalis]
MGKATKFNNFKPSVNSYYYTPSNLGLSAYPLYSLINFSCVPNVMTIYLPDGRVGIVASQAIKRGGQLFTTNGFKFEHHPRALRQTVCKLMFNYDCTCRACQLNYPRFKMLKRLPQLSSTYGEISIPWYKGFDAQFTLKKLPKICEYLENNEKYIPCMEMTLAREQLLYCLCQIFTTDPIAKKFDKFIGPDRFDQRFEAELHIQVPQHTMYQHMFLGEDN